MIDLNDSYPAYNHEYEYCVPNLQFDLLFADLKISRTKLNSDRGIVLIPESRVRELQ